MARRDLTIGIDGDDRGLDEALERSTDKAEGLDRGLSKLERQQAAQERVTATAAAAVRKYSGDMTGAALAARRMGSEAERAADKAARAQVRAAAAADAAKRGVLDEAAATRIAAQADEALERAALKAAAAQIAAAKAAQQQAKAEQALGAEGDRQEKSARQMRGGLVSVGAAAAAVAVPVGAAGIAFAGFAALAVPAVKKVVMAQADLGANWSSLNRNQKVSAAATAGLVTQYKALAKSYEPEALRTFNNQVALGRKLLPELAKTIDANERGVTEFADSLDSTLGRELPRLFDVVRSQGTPALHELGSTVDETSHLAVTLVQDLAPVGMTLLHSTNGVLGLLNALTSVNPKLTEMAAVGLALRGPVTGLAGLYDRARKSISGTAEEALSAAEGLGSSGKAAAGAAEGLGSSGRAAAGAAGKVGLFGRQSRLAALGTKALNAATGAGPTLYIAAAAGLVYLAARMSSVRTATDGMIDRLKGQYQAFGNNVQGYRQYGNALAQLITKQKAAYQQLKDSMPTGPEGFRASNPGGAVAVPPALTKLQKAYDAAQKAQRNVSDGAVELSKEFGLLGDSASTASDKAIQLANAAGVDMSKGILKSGELTADARQKITQYEAAVAAAADPTKRVADDMAEVGNKGLLMQDRLKALTDALAAYYTPAQQAWDATTALKQGWNQLAKAMKAAKGDFSGNTERSQQLRQALSQQLNIVSQLYAANLQTRGPDAAKRALSGQLQVMYALAGRSKSAKGYIDQLAQTFGVVAGKVNVSRSAFLAAAEAMSVPKKRALELWAAYQKLPAVKSTKIDSNAAQRRQEVEAYQAKLDALHGKNVHITDNAADAQARVNRVQQAINALHNRTVTLTTRKIIETIEIAHRTSQAERARADGGIDRYADGGMRRDLDPFIAAKPTVLFGETSTGGEAYIPLGESKRTRSVMLLSDVAKMFGLSVVRPMADGGVLAGGLRAFADGGTLTDASLSEVLQHWTDTKSPTTKAQVDSAVKARKTQINQLRNAEDALYRARHARHKSARDIAAAERRVAAERDDVTAATKKLADAEARYKYGKLTPSAQLGSALGLSIKDTAAFIKNLTTLTDRGYGVLAQHLLAQGDTTAEKTAADAVKMSNSKLSGLNKQVQQADQQATTLASLGSILTIKTAMKGGSTTWDALIAATGLAPNDLAAALKLMSADLAKTGAGQALLAMMKAHGYARGGPIAGPAGTDVVPLWGTAGEYVVPKAPAAAHRQLLDAMTTGRPVQLPTVMVRGGDGASAGRPVVINVYARDDQSAIAVAKETSHELGWEMKKGGSQ
ncbi:hypothetical protein [Actinomadura sp. DC4]|uniref:hypothetical protein n=1 Tax=Actinomadura sp. DC4 TaxID=3055069 RepID=UPI0025B23F25|nr:hypothetical protein [Actinomadura sp. DC4]MDN3356087.1 hypothetical protein [Actinomadura sp. DC4]